MTWPIAFVQCSFHQAALRRGATGDQETTERSRGQNDGLRQRLAESIWVVGCD